MGDDEHKEPAVFLMQTALNLSYLLAKTDGVGTKRLTAKKKGGSENARKKSVAIFFLPCTSPFDEVTQRSREGKKKTGRSKKQHSPVARYCLEVSKFKLTMRLGEVAS